MIEIAGEVNIKDICYLRYGFQSVVIVAHHHRVCICLEDVFETRFC